MCRRGESSHREEGEHPSRDHAYCRQREYGCDYRRRAQLYAGSVDGDEDTYDHCRDGQGCCLAEGVEVPYDAEHYRELGDDGLVCRHFSFPHSHYAPSLSSPQETSRCRRSRNRRLRAVVLVAFFHYIPKELRAYFFPVPFASGLVYLALHYLADTDAAWLAFLAIPLYYIPAALYTLSVIRSRKRGAADKTPKSDV